MEKNIQLFLEPISTFAFITPFLFQFSHDALEVIVTDEAYNTNTSKYNLVIY
jgi:hypothetical protein